ncbi:putative transcriptional regulator [Klebsiella pneumoniae]|nr:putative transcriptional regulator [Klebsiella pneumoniae]
MCIHLNLMIFTKIIRGFIRAEQASLNVLARHTVASALEAVKNADTSGCDPVPEMIARFKKAH